MLLFSNGLGGTLGRWGSLPPSCTRDIAEYVKWMMNGMPPDVPDIAQRVVAPATKDE